MYSSHVEYVFVWRCLFVKAMFCNSKLIVWQGQPTATEDMLVAAAAAIVRLGLLISQFFAFENSCNASRMHWKCYIVASGEKSNTRVSSSCNIVIMTRQQECICIYSYKQHVMAGMYGGAVTKVGW